MTKKLIWISLFAIAMGFLETAVVIYLRLIYYPGGFEFPLKPIEPAIAKVEFMREMATVIMLVATGIFCGITKLQRFAYFVLAFAIWDLFYYIFLFITIQWPQSLFTWDILFLVPIPWVGPVWAPCLLCLIMIIGSIYFIKKIEQDKNYQLKPYLWVILIVGALICILSFMLDYIYFSKHDVWNFANNDILFDELTNYIPRQFNCRVFFCGFALMLSNIIWAIYNDFNLKSNNHEKK